MSKNQIELCCNVSKEFFGPVVSRVVECIATGELSLREIVLKSKIPTNDVKRSLWILLQHNFVTFELPRPGLILYKISINYILKKFRHSRYSYLMTAMLGKDAELLINELSKHGIIEITQTINQILTQIDDSNSAAGKKKSLLEKFSRLAKDNLIIPCLQPAVDLKRESDIKSEPQVHLSTPLKRRRVIESDDEEEENPSKKAKVELEESFVKCGAFGFWQMNFDRFNEYLKNHIIIKAVSLRFDKKTAEVMKAILKLSEFPQVIISSTNKMTGGVSYNEILNYLRKGLHNSSFHLDQILNIMLQDKASFIVKDGEGGGGIFKVDFKKAFKELAVAHICSLIQERYDSKASKIFRLVMMKGMVDQKQIETMVMMDVKETRDYLFRLIKDGFLHMPEVSRATDYQPIKTMYFLTVDITRISQMVLEQCYKAFSNLMTRRNHEIKLNKRVMEKHCRVEMCAVQAADEEVRKEIEDQMTPFEKTQVAKHMKATEMIEKAEDQLDETIFVLETYLSLL